MAAFRGPDVAIAEDQQRCPCRMARSADSTSSARASRRCSPASSAPAGNTAGSTTTWKSLRLTARSRSSSSLVSIGVRQLELPAVLGRLVQQVPLPAGKGHQRHHQPLAQRIDGRIGHLGEQLLEIGEQELGPLGEHGQRRVGAHRAHRLLAVGGHGTHDQPQLLAGIAEGPQPLGQRLRVDLGRLGELVQAPQFDAVLLQPAPIGLLAGHAALDLAVYDQPPLLRIDQEHAPGCSRPLRSIRSGGNSITPTSLASTTRPSVVIT